MKKAFILFAVLFFCSSSVFAGSKYAETVKTQVDVKNAEIVKNAIINACKSKSPWGQWLVAKAGESEITATLNIRSHYVEVKIPFNAEGYEIIYQDSKNMNYNAKKNTIHPKYNQWIANLDKRIRTNIAKTTAE